MAGDFRFGQERPAGEIARGGGDIWGALGNAITSRANARAMRDSQTMKAVADAYAQVHTNETSIRLAQIEAEARAKTELNGLDTVREKSLAERKFHATKAIAEQGPLLTAMEFAERNADKGHKVDITHSVEKGTSIKLTPQEPREPESEGDL